MEQFYSSLLGCAEDVVDVNLHSKLNTQMKEPRLGSSALHANRMGLQQPRY